MAIDSNAKDPAAGPCAVATAGSADPAAGEHRLLDWIPFLAFIGARWRDLGPGRAELVLDQQAHHSNSLDMAHGGVVMTMLDVAMARAGSTLADPNRGEHPTLITIEMKTTFMQPAVGSLRAEGRVVQRTSSMAFCEGDLFDGSGRLSARASGIFKYVKQRKQTS